MDSFELALRGQDSATPEILDYRYREHFHMTQQELEKEPVDIYETNLAIMGIESKLEQEKAKRSVRHREMNIRHEV